MQETWVRSLGQEDPLEKEMATYSSILAWKIPQTQESSGLQSQDWTQESDMTEGLNHHPPARDRRSPLSAYSGPEAIISSDLHSLMYTHISTQYHFLFFWSEGLLFTLFIVLVYRQ